MPDIPAKTVVGYLGVLFILYGFFLTLAGSHVIRLRQIIIVPPGRRTLLGGILCILLGTALLVPEIYIEFSVTEVPTPTQTMQPTTPTSPQPIIVEKVLYASAGTVHIGDEELSGWKSLLGTCFEAEFTLTALPSNVELQLETYGAQVHNTVFMNGRRTAILPVQEPQSPGMRPNYWSEAYSVTTSTEDLVRGLNKLSICAEKLPEGDFDDFQVRAIRLIGTFLK